MQLMYAQPNIHFATVNSKCMADAQTFVAEATPVITYVKSWKGISLIINLNRTCDSRYISASAEYGKQDGGRMKIFFCLWFVGNN